MRKLIEVKFMDSGIDIWQHIGYNICKDKISDERQGMVYGNSG